MTKFSSNIIQFELLVKTVDNRWKTRVCTISVRPPAGQDVGYDDNEPRLADSQHDRGWKFN